MKSFQTGDTASLIKDIASHFKDGITSWKLSKSLKSSKWLKTISLIDLQMPKPHKRRKSTLLRSQLLKKDLQSNVTKELKKLWKIKQFQKQKFNFSKKDLINYHKSNKAQPISTKHKTSITRKREKPKDSDNYPTRKSARLRDKTGSKSHPTSQIK